MFPRAKETPLAAPLLLPDGAESIATEGDGAKERVAMWRKVMLAFPLMVAALVVVVTICSPRTESILRQSEATLGNAPAAPNNASSASDQASNGSFLIEREKPNVDPTDQMKEQNGQDRSRERVGKKQDGFVHFADHTAKERRYEMKILQQVRGDASKCGGDFKTTWEIHPEEYIYSHANSSFEEMNDNYNWPHNNDSHTFPQIQRYSCNVPHPKYYDSDELEIHFERIGPFHGRGNGDWSNFVNFDDSDHDLFEPPHGPDWPRDGNGSDFENYDVKESPYEKLIMREQNLAHKDIYVRGSFVSIITGNGDFLSYPPLHMHHLHLHPYFDNLENNDKILPKRMNGTQLGHEEIGIIGGANAYLDHHFIAQQHGDTLCDVGDADDFSCLLHLFPPGHGMWVRNSQGFRLDFQVNDFRTADTEGEGDGEMPPPLTPLEFYIEVAIFWTPKPQVPATYFQISAPGDTSSGIGAYAVPIDDSSTMIYYNYTHDWRDDAHLPVGIPEDERLAAGIKGVQGLGAGTIYNIIGHGHQSVVDSMFIFKESNESRKVFDAIDTMRPKNHYLPYIPECHNTTLEQTKVRVIDLAMQQGGGELLCEVTKPGLVWAQTPFGSVDGDDGTERTAKPASYGYRDRAMDFHCLKDFRVEPGDTLTFVSFTKSRPSSTLGPVQRGSFAASSISMHEEEGFAESEHSIVRMNFVSDKARAVMPNDDAKNATTKDGLMTNGDAKNATIDDDLYAPPSLFLISRWPYAAPDEACAVLKYSKWWYSFVNKNISGWKYVADCKENRRLARKKSMLDQCPPSISIYDKRPEEEKMRSGQEVEEENFSLE